MNRLIIAALFIMTLISVTVAVTATTYSDWVATPTVTAQGTSNEIGYGSGDVTVVAIASTTKTNLFASLPSDNYQKMTFVVTAGSAYLNGSVATPTGGIPLVVNDVYTVELPLFAKSRGKFFVIPSSTGSIKLIAYKTKP